MIQICTELTGHQLHLTVADDGCGLPADRWLKGYGTNLINGVAAGELEGSYSYRSDNGTYFELTIPLNG